MIVLSEKQHTAKHHHSSPGYTYPGDELLSSDYDSFGDIEVGKKPFTTALVAASIVREVVNRTIDGNGTLKLKQLDAYVWTALQSDVKNEWVAKDINVKLMGPCVQYKNDKEGGYILPFGEAEPRLALLRVIVEAVSTNIPLLEKIISDKFSDRGFTAKDVRTLLLKMPAAIKKGHDSLVFKKGDPFHRAVPDNSNPKGARKRESCDTEQGTSKRAKPSATKAKAKKTPTNSKQGSPKKAKAKKASTREDPETREDQASSSTAGDHSPSGVDVTSLMARLEKVESENRENGEKIAALEREVKSLKEKLRTGGGV